MGVFSSFFSSAAKTAEVNNTAKAIDNFMLTNGINDCHVERSRLKLE